MLQIKQVPTTLQSERHFQLKLLSLSGFTYIAGEMQNIVVHSKSGYFLVDMTDSLYGKPAC